MARKSQQHRAKGKRRKSAPRPIEQRAAVPKTAKVEVPERRAESKVREEAKRNYPYVFSDLRRTLLITGALLALLIILAIFW